MIYINIANFVLNSLLGKNHSVIETYRLKSVVIFFQTILSFVLLLNCIPILYSTCFMSDTLALHKGSSTDLNDPFDF